MADQERLSAIQSYAWTLELLGEALVQHDEMLHVVEGWAYTSGRWSCHR